MGRILLGHTGAGLLARVLALRAAFLACTAYRPLTIASVLLDPTAVAHEDGTSPPGGGPSRLQSGDVRYRPGITEGRRCHNASLARSAGSYTRIIDRELVCSHGVLHKDSGRKCLCRVAATESGELTSTPPAPPPLRRAADAYKRGPGSFQELE